MMPRCGLRLCACSVPFAAIVAAVTPLAAQGRGGGGAPQGEGGGRATWDVTQARGQTRDIDFTTSEGTWMSADLSPDRTWIVFDLLGHIYRMPAAGGEATVLTQTSGVALNFQPRISPDGKTIAFISDRRGQYNLWVDERRRLESAPGVHRPQRDGARAGVDARRQLHRRAQGRPRRRRRRRAGRRHLDVSQGRRPGRAARSLPPAAGAAAVAAATARRNGRACRATAGICTTRCR